MAEQEDICLEKIHVLRDRGQCFNHTVSSSLPHFLSFPLKWHFKQHTGMLVAFSITLWTVKCVCVTRCFFLSIYLRDHKAAVDKGEHKA